MDSKNNDEIIKAITNEYKDFAKNPETIPEPTKMVIIPGRIMGPHESFPGQPAAYFVRSEGTTDSRPQFMQPNSIEKMLQILTKREEIVDFIAGTQPPEEMMKAAEALKAKLEDPSMQQRIRKMYADRKKLEEEKQRLNEERRKLTDELTS
ncbi:hypothetical protein KKC94_02015 [Patescibacteria group bacterium]|nr:hypothetical protein [Patescibacteria group bacterium]